MQDDIADDSDDYYCVGEFIKACLFELFKRVLPFCVIYSFYCKRLL